MSAGKRRLQLQAFDQGGLGGGGAAGCVGGNAASKWTAATHTDTATLLNRHCQTTFLLGGKLSKKMEGKAPIVLL